MNGNDVYSIRNYCNALDELYNDVLGLGPGTLSNQGPQQLPLPTYDNQHRIQHFGNIPRKGESNEKFGGMAAFEQLRNTNDV